MLDVDGCGVWSRDYTRDQVHKEQLSLQAYLLLNTEKVRFIQVSSKHGIY